MNNGAGIATAQQTNVAFYNNAEATFKSRTTGTGTAPTFNGPFTSATRRRNAQRQAAVVNNPTGTAFLYPGMGESTFRVAGDDIFDPFLNPTGQFLTAPFGIFLPGSITGEESYNWGLLP